MSHNYCVKCIRKYLDSHKDPEVQKILDIITPAVSVCYKCGDIAKVHPLTKDI